MTKNCHLTLVGQKPYSSPAPAITGVGISTLHSRAHRRSSKRLFYAHSFMVGLFRAFRRAVLLIGSTNLFKPATLSLSTERGSLSIIRRTTMANRTQISTNYRGYISAQDDLHRLITQSKALLFTLTSNDNHNDLGSEALTDVLWLLTDRLRDVSAAYLQLISQSNLLVNQREVA
jgi:hypothetical protein